MATTPVQSAMQTLTSPGNRPHRIGLAAVVTMVALGGGSCSSTTSGAPVARATVEGFEMAFDPPRVIVDTPGPIEITFTNTGSVPHTFVIQGRGFKLKAFDSGDSDTNVVDLPDGAWFFYCDIKGHRDAGMEGELFVGDTVIPPTTKGT